LRRAGAHPLAPASPGGGLAAASLGAELTTMSEITQAVMGRADIDVSVIGPAQKVRLADEIFAKQPRCWPRSRRCHAWAPAWWCSRCRCTSCS
jgi:hypothetical protein